MIQAQAKCILALKHSSKGQIIFNGTALEKQNIFIRISISYNGCKFFTWKFMRKPLVICSYKLFYHILI